MRRSSKGIRLVRMRNPHGDHHEWKGPWCDGHPAWEELLSLVNKRSLEVQQKIKSQLQKLRFDDDGEFFISFSDFLTFFGHIEICHLIFDNPKTLSHSNNLEVIAFK